MNGVEVGHERFRLKTSIETGDQEEGLDGLAQANHRKFRHSLKR